NYILYTNFTPCGLHATSGTTGNLISFVPFTKAPPQGSFMPTTQKKPRNNWQRKRAIRGLKSHKADTPGALMVLLRDLLASALQRAGLTATVVHDVQHQLVKLTNIKHTKAHAPDSGDFG